MLTGQIVAAIMLWIANYYYPDQYIEKGFFTFLALAIIYFVFKLALEHFLAQSIKDGKTKYSVRKAISIIYVLVFFAILTQIWATSTDALFVSYGIMGAGIAIALQDLFKNFVGGLTIFLTSIYRVGDRVEIDSRFGDVIDIGMMYTTLLEIREWVDGDQATGRLSMMPNGVVLSKSIINYTKDHSFIWDEITLPLTYESDWREAAKAFENIARKETERYVADAEKQMAAIMQKYYFSARAVEPAVFVTVTDNWIALSIRYITDARHRREIKSELHQLIKAHIEASEGKIVIASESMIVAMSHQ